MSANEYLRLPLSALECLRCDRCHRHGAMSPLRPSLRSPPPLLSATRLPRPPSPPPLPRLHSPRPPPACAACSPQLLWTCSTWRLNGRHTLLIAQGCGMLIGATAGIDCLRNLTLRLDGAE
jgi:hypothetical protein